jgi:hypothetical protein
MILLHNVSEMAADGKQLAQSYASYHMPKMASCSASIDVLHQLIQIFSRFDSQEDISIEISNLKQHCEHVLVQQRQLEQAKLEKSTILRIFEIAISAESERQIFALCICKVRI